LQARKDDISSFLKNMGDLKNTRIIFTGAGSSAYIGEDVASVLGKAAGIHCEAIATTDIVLSPESVLFADTPTLLVSFARSGNSPESVGAVKYARGIVKDLRELAIVCDGNSKLAKMTAESSKSMTLVMPEGSNDKGFAMTSSVTCMTLACYAFFNAGKIDEICGDIANLAETVEKQSVSLADAARSLAEKDYERMIVIGSGCCKGIAREAALKSMELTAGAVNTNYESSLGFRHGPKAVIKDNTLTIHLISPASRTGKYDLDLLDEVARQKKGNKIVALSTALVWHKVDENIVIPVKADDVDSELYFGICSLVFCQMLAMFKSIKLGLPVDNPVPTGEVNRVVTGVTIYEL
jgi:tagatose-6-phosphate ketose/aldose isomerase